MKQESRTNQIIMLNYILKRDRKYYGGHDRKIVSTVKSSVDSYNRETSFEIDSHTGTHIDYPAHAVENGLFGDEYPIDYLYSDKCCAIHCNLLDDARPIITYDMISKTALPQDCEILLIKTGLCHFRDDDRYWTVSPVVEPDIPLKLKEQFPALKAVGFDIISVTSQLDKQAGKKCHYNFLSETINKPILIIEDMDLNKINSNTVINNVKVLPLGYEKMDGALCVIIAEIE